ncbi:Alpha-1,3-mannosyl-glycoprotein 4-beta-N-acetylglucosaminyltransferase C [Liparis tanakae]|uniref:Alpha-1,3-mannosyl-glycoprotein 4-beta-N-acetylglucosaminyltransferase C n=1 Tax=Liparis tanakae TaxID=230148 RepID=A0A4Z2GKV9_9TELE|nr:Alpha-1,3-mannosyl-glycoprotein 4-beta-N-acetylglucosaminyltransferase C [Liparis tanakae]
MEPNTRRTTWIHLLLSLYAPVSSKRTPFNLAKNARGGGHRRPICVKCKAPLRLLDPSEAAYGARLAWKSLDKMRCLRKRSAIPFLGFLITFLLFLNLYIEDGYVLLKDDDFEEDSVDIPDNPPASMHTNIDVFESYDAAKAYSTVDEYFWGKPPSTGDFFVVVFNKSTKISKIKIATGSDDRQNDVLHHGALEVGEKLVGTKKGKQCSSYITLGEFKNGNIEVQDVDHKIAFDIECVRIVVTASQKEWLIIRSISLWTTQPPSQ